MPRSKTDKAFIGAYIQPELKRKIEEEAKNQHRSMSNLLTLVLEDHFDHDRHDEDRPDLAPTG